ncbi:DUF1015 family protein [Candidatus Poriferisodalis sp.]|uniref:DUF1015 family protein n=1 Tax=Candidatus Poriferisodalis sp. TaxID=3101277 RepID=UPI003B01A13E
MIEPVSARVLTPEWAPSVIPAPYDSLTPDEHAQHLADNPDSFAHVAGLPAESFGHPSEHLRHAARSTEALERLIGLGAFGATRSPGLYVQRVEADGHAQHALLGGVRLSSIELRPHEDTQPGRVHGLAVHFTEVGRMSSPVVVTAPRLSMVSEVIDATLAAAEASTPSRPLLDTKTTDGARVTLWPAVVGGGDGASVGLDGPLYIVDGHHRVAAARQAGFSHVLVACVPTDELYLGSFDRELSELDMMPRRVVELLRGRCDVTEVPDAAAARPAEPGWIGMGVAGHWFRVRRHDTAPSGDAPPILNPATLLDAAFVHDFVLGEIFGVTSASDPRINFRPTTVGAAPAPVTIMLAPVPLGSVFEVADFGGVMPPKTTYFLPKARSGLLLVRC